jgi:hypothetical protein
MPSPGRVVRRIGDSRGGFARAVRFGLGTRKNKDPSQNQVLLYLYRRKEHPENRIHKTVKAEIFYPRLYFFPPERM